MRNWVIVGVSLIGMCIAATVGMAQESAPTSAPPRAKSAPITGPGSFSLEAIQAMLDAPGAHDAFIPQAPFGLKLTDFYIPEDNPITPAKVALGKQLYFDKRLSLDNTVSCATCHHPVKGWTDQAPVSTGIQGQKGGRSAPTVMNRVFGTTQFWDGRAATLEEQALGPIGNPIEMGFSVDKAVARLNKIEGYRVQFERIFGTPVTSDGIAKAIASFERTVLAGAAPNDYYEALQFELGWEGDEDDDADDRALRQELLAAYKANPLSEAAARGRVVYFGKGRCDQCHLGQNFSDEQFHNLGAGDSVEANTGREAISNNLRDRGAYKTPTLRNIADTAPYMHDGSEATLRDVVVFYNKGGGANPALSEKMKPLGLTDQEIDDLVAFMEQGLQGSVTFASEPPLP